MIIKLHLLLACGRFRKRLLAATPTSYVRRRLGQSDLERLVEVPRAAALGTCAVRLAWRHCTPVLPRNCPAAPSRCAMGRNQTELES